MYLIKGNFKFSSFGLICTGGSIHLKMQYNHFPLIDCLVTMKIHKTELDFCLSQKGRKIFAKYVLNIQIYDLSNLATDLKQISRSYNSKTTARVMFFTIIGMF